MNRSWKKVVLGVAKFSIPLAIIAFLLWQVGREGLREFVDQPKDYGLLALAFFIAFSAVALSFARWGLLVRCQGIEISMLETFRLSSIGFLLSFVSAGSVGGDVFKAFFLAKRRPGKRLEAVASVFVDRGVGMYGLALLVGLVFLLQSPTGATDSAREALVQIRRVTWVLVGTGTVVLSLLIFGGKWVESTLQLLGRVRFVGRAFLGVAGPLRMFHHHPIAFFFSVLMSLGVHAGLTLSIYLMARGLYASPPTLADHFVIVPVGMFASALPLAPAGIGVFEAAIAWLYKTIPRTATEASGTLVALTYELVKLALAAIGTLFYWTAKDEVRRSLDEVERATNPE